MVLTRIPASSCPSLFLNTLEFSMTSTECAKRDVFSVAFNHLRFQAIEIKLGHGIIEFFMMSYVRLRSETPWNVHSQQIYFSTAQEGFQIGFTRANFTGEMPFCWGNIWVKGLQTHKYIWDPLQQNTQALWSHQSIAFLARGCIVCVCTTTYISYMMYTHDMYMTIILLGMYVYI